jgi:hypothetical protein
MTLTTGIMFLTIHLQALLGVGNCTNVVRVCSDRLWSDSLLPKLRNTDYTLAVTTEEPA